MVDQFKVIKIKESVKNQLMNECKQEFLIHHPEFQGMNLTHNFMIKKLVDYYLR